MLGLASWDESAVGFLRSFRMILPWLLMYISGAVHRRGPDPRRIRASKPCDVRSAELRDDLGLPRGGLHFAVDEVEWLALAYPCRCIALRVSAGRHRPQLPLKKKKKHRASSPRAPPADASLGQRQPAHDYTPARGARTALLLLETADCFVSRARDGSLPR